MEREPQRVIDDIESQVIATHQELAEDREASFKMMKSGRTIALKSTTS